MAKLLNRLKNPLFNDVYHEPFLPTWNRLNDPSLNAEKYNTTEYTLYDGNIVIHLVHPKHGIAWTVRHARGVADDRVESWRVIRGLDGVQIAWSAKKSLD